MSNAALRDVASHNKTQATAQVQICVWQTVVLEAGRGFNSCLKTVIGKAGRPPEAPISGGPAPHWKRLGEFDMRFPRVPGDTGYCDL